MNSYYEKRNSNHAPKLNPCADIFVLEQNNNDNVNASNTSLQPVVRTKQKSAIQITNMPQSACAQINYHQSPNTSAHLQSEIQTDHQTSIIDIMQRQNDITAMFVQQNQNSVLPPRNIPVFDGDPLQYK